jgi:selenocysteine-specific elongation factor
VRVRPLGPDTVRLRLGRPLPLRIGDRAVLRDPAAGWSRPGWSCSTCDRPSCGGGARRRPGPHALAEMTGRPDASGELAAAGWCDGSTCARWACPSPIWTRSGPPPRGGWIAPEVAVERAAALADALAAHDAADPVDPGLPVEAARRARACPTPGSSSRCCGSPSAPISWCATAG